MPQKCHAIGCNEPAIVKGLCDKHRKRLERHGHIETTRSEDWGKREKHPAYKSWCGLVRFHKQSIPTAWANDFWEFVKNVPEKPSEKARAWRARQDEPWSSSNFYWKESRVDADIRAQRATYMREWQRASRALTGTKSRAPSRATFAPSAPNQRHRLFAERFYRLP
jgi:hypothetical protein